MATGVRLKPFLVSLSVRLFPGASMPAGSIHVADG
jgi:hypothetical protein